ncbi:methyltransferase domain-containing protein [Synechococcus sp. MU1611]|uniref:methyltransferase domain-containing protein n=1 Tax=Synechococcus sp. MU1611 TaxID=2508345 RepID=UPI001CF8C931|nr:methyltransferase domain-containing protein [Synechococcus sp. MU1611]MCB4411496.1 class I SAM-dependent methyltransferase [Synechococcus sp. MU1611]
MDKVISKQQLILNQALHQSEDNFGNRETAAGFAKYLPETLNRFNELGACNSFLDYGTGKGKLVDTLRQACKNEIKIQGYDPAVGKYACKPDSPFDIVGCFDVLEHIEMESIDAVLRDIHSLTKIFCYLVIDLQPAVKKMQDGRNAHILLAPPEWWTSRVAQLFPCITAFPAMHACGLPQKVVIAAAKKPKHMGLVYSFLMKQRIFKMTMHGGVLQKKYLQK